MNFPTFEHLKLFEDTAAGYLNISFSNVKGFRFGEFGRAVPKQFDLNWTDPRGSPELRGLIARRHGVPPDHVLVTGGATEANFLVNAALVEAGDRVVVDAPIYSPLRDCAAGFGADLVVVERDCESDWAFDADQLRKAAGPRARLLVLANLNNPTSAVLSRAQLEGISDLAEDRGAYVLVDETFRELAFGGRPPTAARLGPRMIAISTVTKVCGLGGLRVGWIVAEPALLARFRGVKDYTTVCGSGVGQLLATWALRRYGFFLQRARRILGRNRKLVREALQSMPLLSGEVPEVGTVLFPHCRANVAKLADELLRRRRTIIAPGRYFGMADHFRIGVGGDTAELEQGLANLKEALSAAA